jgi:hypothetical protein
MPLLTQDNTTQKDEDKIHALSGIRIHDPSNQPAKTHASDRTATVTGCSSYYSTKIPQKDKDTKLPSLQLGPF